MWCSIGLCCVVSFAWFREVFVVFWIVLGRFGGFVVSRIVSTSFVMFGSSLRCFAASSCVLACLRGFCRALDADVDVDVICIWILMGRGVECGLGKAYGYGSRRASVSGFGDLNAPDLPRWPTWTAKTGQNGQP